MRILSMRRGGVSHFYHADGLGSTRQLTDSTQTVTDTYLYKAFGELVTSTGTTINPLRYVGQVNYYDDGTSGLMLLGVRYYDSAAGRWSSRDPRRDEVNWYSYTWNAPTLRLDPEGLSVSGLATCYNQKDFGCCCTSCLQCFQDQLLTAAWNPQVSSGDFACGSYMKCCWKPYAKKPEVCVTVLMTDHGPFTSPKIIDLSRGAAQQFYKAAGMKRVITCNNDFRIYVTCTKVRATKMKHECKTHSDCTPKICKGGKGRTCK